MFKRTDTVLLKINRNIDTECFSYIEKNVETLIASPPENLILYIRSIGGDAGIAKKCLLELEKLSKKNVSIITISYDFVNSAALILYGYAPLRLSHDKKDSFYFHKATGEISELCLKKEEQGVFDYLARCFNQNAIFIEHLAETNSVIKAEEAVTLGISHNLIKTNQRS